jgi:hypothetical protein
MAITFSPSKIPNVQRKIPFTKTINVSDDLNGNITSVNVSLQGEVEPNVSISTTNTSFTISGVYRKGWVDSAKYVRKGSSDLIENSTTLDDIDAIPANQELYEYFPDPRKSLTKTYSVIVTYTPFESSNTTETFSLEHIVENNIQNFTTYINSYFNPEVEPYVFTFVWTNDNGDNMIWLNAENKSVTWEAN